MASQRMNGKQKRHGVGFFVTSLKIVFFRFPKFSHGISCLLETEMFFLFIGCSEACGKLQYLATGEGGGNTRSGAALFLQLNINKNRMDQHKVRLRCPTKDILSSWW